MLRLEAGLSTTVVVSGRVSPEVADWLATYAQSRGVKPSRVVGEAVVQLRGLCEGGVPDIPAGPVGETPAHRQMVGETPRQDLRRAPVVDHAWARQQALNKAKGL